MTQASCVHFVGEEKYVCSYCAGILGKLPEMEINVPMGIIFEDVEGKILYFHPQCALRLSNEFNEAVIRYMKARENM